MLIMAIFETSFFSDTTSTLANALFFTEPNDTFKPVIIEQFAFRFPDKNSLSL